MLWLRHRPMNFQVTNRSPVRVANIEQPAEHIVVIDRVEVYFASAIEYRADFGVYGATGP